MKIRFAFLSLVWLGASGVAMAQWQWQDKDGRLVFSDRAPPSDIQEKSILKRPANAPKPAAGKPTDGADAAAAAPQEATSVAAQPAVPGGVDKDLVARKKQAEKAAAEAEAAKRRAEEERVLKARVENCARAKQALATLDSGVRLTRTNPNGEREVLDDVARANERAQAQKGIASECR